MGLTPEAPIGAAEPTTTPEPTTTQGPAATPVKESHVTEQQQIEQNVAEKQVVVAATPGKLANQTQNIVEQIKQAMAELNPEFDLDWVNLGQWISLSKLGKFVIKSNGEVVEDFGPELYAIVVAGEKRFQRWPTNEEKEKSVYPDGLICSSSDQVTSMYGEVCAECTHNREKCKMRFMAVMTPTDRDPELPFPRIFLMNWSPTATYKFGDVTRDLFLGTNKNLKAKGFKALTPIAKVVMRLWPTEEKMEGGSETYLAVNFEPVALADGYEAPKK
ncbi:MAG: hypothetical protein WA118_08175 [Carboxydocellales bacterium]